MGAILVFLGIVPLLSFSATWCHLSDPNCGIRQAVAAVSQSQAQETRKVKKPAAGNFKQKRILFSGRIDDICAADMNQDGYSDLIVLDYPSKSIKVLMGDKKAEFKKSYVKKIGDMDDMIAGVADFTGDNKLDIAVTSLSQDKLLYIIPGNGNGQLKKARAIKTDNPSIWDYMYMTTCDFNSDGRPDILALRMDDSLTAFQNQGKGKFKVNELAEKVGDDGLAPGDFDGDDYMDFFVGEVTQDKVYFFKGHGDGTFSQTKSFNCKDLGEELYPVDINGDGKLDLVGGGDNAGDAWTMLSKKKGKMARNKTLPGEGSLVYGASFNDFNRDGYVDIASAEKYGIYYYRSRSKGKFDSPLIIGNGLQFNRSGSVNCSSNICQADFNGDGLPDIAGAQYFGSTVNPDSNIVLFLNGGTPSELQIANLYISSLTFTGYNFYLHGSLDFSGKEIDISYNSASESPTDGAFLYMRIYVSLSFGSFSAYYRVSGEFLHKPGANSGTIDFDLVLPSPQIIIGTYSATVSLSYISLFDSNLVHSNTIYP